jgi:hypothetical protein
MEFVADGVEPALAVRDLFSVLALSGNGGEEGQGARHLRAVLAELGLSVVEDDAHRKASGVNAEIWWPRSPARAPASRHCSSALTGSPMHRSLRC